METETYSSYEEATEEYLIRFLALREAPPAPAEVTTRGAGDLAVETIIERAEEIADVSASMVGLAQDYIESPNPLLREGISGQLLAQAAAELQVASELLQVGDFEQEGPPAPATRAARGVALRDAINALEKSLETLVSEGLTSQISVRRAGELPAATQDQAKIALTEAASTTAGSISQRVIELGGDIAFDLVFHTEWTVVIESARLVSQDIGKLMDTLKEGAGALISRAVTAAAKTLINVYDKILALLGKDVEDEARKKIEGWLEEIKQVEKIELFDRLIAKLYGVEELKQELSGCLAGTSADLEIINQTADSVAQLSDKFAVFVGRMHSIETAVGLAKLLKAPQVLLVITGIRAALLAIVIYAGNDYIGYREPRFPNLTKGVAEVVRDNLAC